MYYVTCACGGGDMLLLICIHKLIMDAVSIYGRYPIISALVIQAQFNM